MIGVESGRSRRQLVLNAVTALLAVVLCVVLGDHFVLQAEWWQVNRTVTQAPQPPLADLGPPAGPVTASWQLNTPVGDSELPAYDRVAYSIVDGELVVVSGHGLDVRDARTGRERWHYYRNEWSMLGWARTGPYLVVYLERTGHRGNRLMVGLDAVSGTLLWRQRRAIPAATDRTTLRWPAAGGVVFVTEDGRHVLYGRSARTGRRLWSKRLAHGCLLPEAMPFASGGSESVAAFSVDCGDRDRVLVVDPHTGHTLFTVPTRNTAHSAVAVDEDVTAVFDGSALQAFDRTGHRFLVRTGENVCRDMCPIAAAGGHLLVAYGLPPHPGEGTATRRLESVQIGSGVTAWHRDTSGYAALTVAGGVVYGLRPRVADSLLPAGIDVVDPVTGAGTTVPVPMVLRAGLDGVRPWLAAGGGLLYVAVPEVRPRPLGGARLMALRGGIAGDGPPELAGVPSGDWPDACSLLDPGALPGYVGEPVTATVDDVRLRAGCTYRPRRSRPSRTGATGWDDDAPSVTLQWVAADPGSAAALFAAARDTQNAVRDPVRAGDAAYALGASADTVVMRCGRAIVSVTAARPGLATSLAAHIAHHLDAGT